MKRYLLFAGTTYYPSGGWEDLEGSFDSVEEANAAFKAMTSWNDWYQIVDSQTGEKVDGSG